MIELYPRVGFVVSNLARPAERVVAFYNQRGTAERWIREGKGVTKWTRLSCRTFAPNAVRPQLHALTYNLGNFMRTLAISAASTTSNRPMPGRTAHIVWGCRRCLQTHPPGPGPLTWAATQA
jgi:hypothetical protein